MDEIGFALMNTLASDARALGKEDNESLYEDNDTSFDMRPDMDILTLETYLLELRMSSSEYEHLFR